MLSFALLLMAAQPGPLQLESWEKSRCSQGQTNYELRQCAGERFREAERALNHEWRRAAQMLKAEDAGSARRKLRQPSRFASALAAQRAWLQYREAQCRTEYNQYAGGTHAPLARLICLDRLTRARAVELRDLQRP